PETLRSAEVHRLLHERLPQPDTAVFRPDEEPPQLRLLAFAVLDRYQAHQPAEARGQPEAVAPGIGVHHVIMNGFNDVVLEAMVVAVFFRIELTVQGDDIPNIAGADIAADYHLVHGDLAAGSAEEPAQFAHGRGYGLVVVRREVREHVAD